MYAPYHLAAGALTEKGLKTRVPTAGVALLSAALLDNLLLRNPIIEPIQHIHSPWPPGTPAILQIVPYPGDLLSTFVLIALVVLTPALAYLMRHYWWGMLWAVLPDIIDWVILYPTIGKHPIHDLFDSLSTPWGLAVEVTIIVIIVGTIVWIRRRKHRAVKLIFETKRGVDEMNEQKDKPMANISFRIMSVLLALYHRVRDVRKELEKVGIRKGQIVLDFGCGPGHYTVAAARIVGEKGIIYALDIHPLAVKAVEKRARKLGLANVTTILSDRDTGLPEESVDVVLLYDAIQLITDKEALIKELNRVTKPDGLLSILAEHIKVKDVVQLAEKEGLFSLRNRDGKLLNFEKGL